VLGYCDGQGICEGRCNVQLNVVVCDGEVDMLALVPKRGCAARSPVWTRPAQQSVRRAAVMPFVFLRQTLVKLIHPSVYH